MPLSSAEIAQLNATFQAQAMNNMSYAQSVGQGGSVYGGGYQGHGGDRAMGSAMGMAGAVGSPLMAGAMGMAGLDPMSLGLKAGIGSFMGGAGLGGAMAVGGAVALPMMAAGAAVHYAGGQMMQGAQQQQQLNSNLRAGFNFQNQYGGQGFQRSEMSSIGSMVRDMSEQFGPGGEIASFRELSGLAGKMGSMGFGQGVKDVKDFTTRFKEMVKTLKTMATDLGTTLEGAMEFAQAAKSSGVFGMQGAQKFTAAARGATVSGGLALSEVTGAASIGSQISRSMGGLGRQGAMAGVRTIGQIGNAQQMGVLSEEDIYNVTGLTGAEGRQAYAASAMSSSAKFLQSGRGRRTLASMAGKNGTLDENAVQELLQGGMGIGETMKQDQAHLGKVGRANFIRNEGRLRGAALERLGGFLPAIQMQEWAASKGVDINDMDDRSMLFAQRQLGMGRDEVDAAVKMANAMPQILQREKRAESQDQYFQGLAQARKGQGVEGVKQRFEQAKELINGKLQKAGQDIFNAGSDAVDSFFNKLFGTYVETYSKDIDQNYQSMMRGGALGREAAGKAFGIGKGAGMSKQFQRLSAGGAAGLLGGAGQADLAKSLTQGTEGGFFESLGQNKGLDYLLHGQSGAGKLKELGYDVKGMDSKQIQAKLLSIQAQQQAAATGFDPTAVQAAAGGDFLSTAYAMGRVTGKGDDRQNQIEALIRKQAAGDPNDKNTKAAQAMVAQLDAAKGSTAKAALIGNYERAQKVDAAAQLSTLSGLGEGGMAALLAKQGTRGFGSVGEENKAFANALGVKGFAQGSLQQRMHDFLSKLPGAKESGMATERESQAGAYAKSEEFRSAVTGLFSANEKESKAAREALMQDIQSQTGKETGRTEVQRNLLTGMDYLTYMNANPNATEAEQQAWLAKNGPPGATLDGVKGALAGAKDILTARQAKDREELSRRIKVESGKSVESLKSLGIMDAKTGALTTGSAEELLKKGGKQSVAYVQAMLKQEVSKAAMGVEGVDLDVVDANQKMLAGLSVEQKRQVAATLGGTVGAEAGYEAGIQTRLERGDRRGPSGRAKAVAGMLGVAMDPAELKRLGGNSDQLAQAMMEKAGMKVEGNDSIREQLAAALGQKDKGKAAQALAGVMGSEEVQKAKAKQKEGEDEAANPIQAAIKKNTDKTNDLLKLIATSSGVTADQIAKLEPKDPESK